MCKIHERVGWKIQFTLPIKIIGKLLFGNSFAREKFLFHFFIFSFCPNKEGKTKSTKPRKVSISLLHGKFFPLLLSVLLLSVYNVYNFMFLMWLEKWMRQCWSVDLFIELLPPLLYFYSYLSLLSLCIFVIFRNNKKIFCQFFVVCFDKTSVKKVWLIKSCKLWGSPLTFSITRHLKAH